MLLLMPLLLHAASVKTFEMTTERAVVQWRKPVTISLTIATVGTPPVPVLQPVEGVVVLDSTVSYGTLFGGAVDGVVVDSQWQAATCRYHVQFERCGAVLLPAAQCVVDGDTARSNSIEFEVQEGAVAPDSMPIMVRYCMESERVAVGDTLDLTLRFGIRARLQHDLEWREIIALTQQLCDSLPEGASGRLRQQRINKRTELCNGERFRVVEATMEIIGEKAGSMTIPARRFRYYILTPEECAMRFAGVLKPRTPQHGVLPPLSIEVYDD